ncbi:cytochrome P450 [Aspergillus campestris IBT 28561]|uniref:Cytochrome P450 n=1 Tax=Aspergillus campestris (strain IBT 28561) TaxID=1392248 RepID=A0A2I1CT62_ASPC2|nr:cytochrome P450 [Aspergillus campestris IBT 28561]PKY00826.1 cytochrome P450 [Aspergillus campestris IBT 28561]
MDTHILWLGCAATVGYVLLQSIYRLYFHPLRKFPGPRLAALTSLYEFYYNVIRSGKFLFEIERMHEQYGPIVRINPREIHIKDSDYYDQIYISRIQDKDPYHVRSLSVPLSSAATVHHELHRRRRELINPFFSKRSVMGLEHLVQDKVDQVGQHLTKAQVNRTVVSLDELFAGLTADVISKYTFGESIGILDTEDLRNDFRDALTAATSFAHVARFSSLVGFMSTTVPRFVEWINPRTKGFFDIKRSVEGTILDTWKGEKSKGTGKQKTIFDTLCDPSLPAEERTLDRIRDEALVILAAGTETTARVLTIGFFHIYRDPSILQKLRDEIKQVMPQPTDRVSLAQLEKLPYLTAVINESFRVSHSVTVRLPRVLPTALQYKNYTIPPGTSVSQAIYFVHMDPTVFPSPETFRPERWIEATDKGERLNRYLVPFTKGPRICVGLNLAYAELYQVFATLIRRFDLEIYNTTPESIHVTRDVMIGLPDTDEMKVYSLVTGTVG